MQAPENINPHCPNVRVTAAASDIFPATTKLQLEPQFSLIDCLPSIRSMTAAKLQDAAYIQAPQPTTEVYFKHNCSDAPPRLRQPVLVPPRGGILPAAS